MKDVVIIDYGMGNLKSVSNALTFLGYQPRIAQDRASLAAADGLVLPGVGAFGEAMQNLRKLDLLGVLNEQVIERKKPILGICLGMQLMALDSEEMGHFEGLGWVDGHVVRIKPEGSLRLPHVGWSSVQVRQAEPLFRNIETEPHYFFDHTYQLQCAPEHVLATCQYGGEIVAAIRRGNVMATQFHPEKSQVKGLKLLRNFMNYVEASKA
jgi:glutamine amidotransferase